MMDRTQILLVWIPLFLLTSDLYNLFAPPPPKQDHHRHQHHPPPSKSQSATQQPSREFPAQKASGLGAIGYGNTVSIDFCTSCSYRGTAVTMKNMLETQFPGINVVLANYPPSFPKRILSKIVPVPLFGVMLLAWGGEHIFPRIGFAVPPRWYYTLRANKFGVLTSAYFLGNFLQSSLRSSGAFEVYCNGELVFSKLQWDRFPGEIELKDLVAQRIAGSKVVNDLSGAQWS